VTFRVGSDNSGVEFVKVADMSNVTTDFTDEGAPAALGGALHRGARGAGPWLRPDPGWRLGVAAHRRPARPVRGAPAVVGGTDGGGASDRCGPAHVARPIAVPVPPFDWSAASRLSTLTPARRARVGEPPPVDQQVVCHGDACAPNTLIDDDGTRVGHVDFGSLGVADRWADLAVAMLSLAGTIQAGCGTPSSSPPTASSPTRCASTTTGGSGRSRMGPTPHAKLEAIRERPERYLCRSPASATPAS